jgi:hypothetical protein
MTLLLCDSAEGGVERVPFRKQLFENLFSVGGKAVEALVAFLVFAPFADQEGLGLEAAQQGIERAFVDLKTVLGEFFAEGVSILLCAQSGEDGEHQTAAAEFQPEVLEGFRVHNVYDALHRM